MGGWTYGDRGPLPANDVDLAAGSALQRNLVTTINEVVDKVNRIEIMRMQVEDLRTANAANKQVDGALAALCKRMYEAELHYLSRTEMHSDDKYVAGGLQPAGRAAA